MHRKGRIILVGIGPGDPSLLTPLAKSALLKSDVIIGYVRYLKFLRRIIRSKEIIGSDVDEVSERAYTAVEFAKKGMWVGVVSSGDTGIYGMAGPILHNIIDKNLEQRIEVDIVPGVPAMVAAASLLGAPINDDFAVISLSDIVTPWKVIESRLKAAVKSDFTIVLYNPSSSKRHLGIRRVRKILAAYRPLSTPVGIVRNAYRGGEQVVVTTLGRMLGRPIDMDTMIIVGNSRSRHVAPWMITSRTLRVRRPGFTNLRGSSIH